LGRRHPRAPRVNPVVESAATGREYEKASGPVALSRRTGCRPFSWAGRGDGRLLGLLAWRRAFAEECGRPPSLRPARSSRFPGSHSRSQRNPWGREWPGCIYYGDAKSSHGKARVRDRQTPRAIGKSCIAMRPKGTDEKDLTGVFPTNAPALKRSAQTQRRRCLNRFDRESLADLDNIRLPWKDLFPRRIYGKSPQPDTESDRGWKRRGAIPSPLRTVPINWIGKSTKWTPAFNVHLTIDPEFAAHRAADEPVVTPADSDQLSAHWSDQRREVSAISSNRLYEKAAGAHGSRLC